jgi:hypothetical protein
MNVLLTKSYKPDGFDQTKLGIEFHNLENLYLPFKLPKKTQNSCKTSKLVRLDSLSTPHTSHITSNSRIDNKAQRWTRKKGTIILTVDYTMLMNGVSLTLNGQLCF